MAASTTARERREARKAEAARSLAFDLAAHDVTQREVAEATGVGDQIVQRWCDRERAESMPLADVEALPREVAVEQIRRTADAVGYDLVPRRKHETVEDDLQHLADLSTEQSELVAHFARVIADGQVTAAEAEAGIRECDDVLSLVESLRARLLQALQARGEGVRRIDWGQR